MLMLARSAGGGRGQVDVLRDDVTTLVYQLERWGEVFGSGGNRNSERIALAG